MKSARQGAIRELVMSTQVQSQDELRRKLKRRGFAVTQATLSRDLHELHLFKGPRGYSLPQSNGNSSTALLDAEDDSPPTVHDVLDSFGLRVTHALNQVIIRTVMGGAQPVAAALDYEEWSEVVGTIAGDDTVLVICADAKNALVVEARIRKSLV